MNKLLYLFCIAGISACSPKFEKALEIVTKTKANAQVTQQEIHRKHSDVTAQFAAAAYPVKQSTNTTTEIVQGNAEQLKRELARSQNQSDSLNVVLSKLKAKPECTPEVEELKRIISFLQQRIIRANQQVQALEADRERIITTTTEENTAALDAEKALHEITKSLYLAEKAEHNQTRKEKAVVEADNKEKDKRLLICYIVIGGSLLVFIGAKALGMYLGRRT